MSRPASFRFDVWLVTIAPLLAVIGLLIVFSRDLPITPMRIVGYILLISGIVLVTIARFDLGNSFSVEARARHLVTCGIYSKVRHPVYIFSAVALAGAVLVAARPLLLILLLPLGIVQLRRARKEEAVLEAAFGDEYRRYRTQTWL